MPPADSLHHLIHRAGLPEVGLHREAAVAKPRRRRIKARAVRPGHDDFGSFLGEKLRGREADAGRAPVTRATLPSSFMVLLLTSLGS
jgi:hypothetical protein